MNDILIYSYVNTTVQTAFFDAPPHQFSLLIIYGTSMHFSSKTPPNKDLCMRSIFCWQSVVYGFFESIIMIAEHMNFFLLKSFLMFHHLMMISFIA